MNPCRLIAALALVLGVAGMIGLLLYSGMGSEPTTEAYATLLHVFQDVALGAATYLFYDSTRRGGPKGT